MAKNKMNTYMKANKYGSAAQQLYAQFFVRILKIVEYTDIMINIIEKYGEKYGSNR